MIAEQAEQPCRNCRGSDMRFRFEVKGCMLDRCEACGYVQVRDIPLDEELADIYRQPYFEKAKYVDDAAARYEFARRVGMLVGCGLRAGWRVLDYGCAGGEFVHGIADRCEARGVDYAADGIQKAKERYASLAGDFATLDDLPALGSFDAVVMWDVIEHVPWPPDTLSLISRSLKPGGWLILSTPNIGAPIARLMGRRWAFMTPPEHLGFFDRRSMKVAVDRAGFDLVDWSSRGKWVNLSFLFYKAGRVFPHLFPAWLWKAIARSPFGRFCLYVPTGDIQYVVCRKRG